MARRPSPKRSTAKTRLLDKALELPVRERERLARQILESVDADYEAQDEFQLDPAFAKELERRLADEPPPGGWPRVEDVLDRLTRELNLPPRRRKRRRRGA